MVLNLHLSSFILHPLYINWNPNEIAFSIWWFSFRWYSLCWLIGLALAYFIVRRLYKEQKIKDELFDPLFIYCFLGILAVLWTWLFSEQRHPYHRDVPAHPQDVGWFMEIHWLWGTCLTWRNVGPDACPVAVLSKDKGWTMAGARQHRHCHPRHRLLHPLGQPDELRNHR